MARKPAPHDFSLVLDRAPTGDEIDALYEAGLDDASPEHGPNASLLHVTRYAPSLTDAVLTAVRDTESTGMRVVAVRAEDLITLRTIAQRVGRTYEWARKLAHNAPPNAGSASFPPALSGEGWSLYSWVEVSRWLAEHRALPDQATTHDRELAALDHVIRARAMTAGSPMWDAVLTYFATSKA